MNGTGMEAAARGTAGAPTGDPLANTVETAAKQERKELAEETKIYVELGNRLNHDLERFGHSLIRLGGSLPPQEVPEEASDPAAAPSNLIDEVRNQNMRFRRALDDLEHLLGRFDSLV